MGDKNSFDLMRNLSAEEMSVEVAVDMYGPENVRAVKMAGYVEEVYGNLCLSRSGKEITNLMYYKNNVQQKR